MSTKKIIKFVCLALLTLSFNIVIAQKKQKISVENQLRIIESSIDTLLKYKANFNTDEYYVHFGLKSDFDESAINAFFVRNLKATRMYLDSLQKYDTSFLDKKMILSIGNFEINKKEFSVTASKDFPSNGGGLTLLIIFNLNFEIISSTWILNHIER
jgi:hypothetical protein